MEKTIKKLLLSLSGLFNVLSHTTSICLVFVNKNKFTYYYYKKILKRILSLPSNFLILYDNKLHTVGQSIDDVGQSIDDLTDQPLPSSHAVQLIFDKPFYGLVLSLFFIHNFLSFSLYRY